MFDILLAPPCLPHHPEDSLIALCLSFLRTLHTNRMSGLKIIHTTKRNEGEPEQQEGSRRLGTETCILWLAPSCRWRVVTAVAVPAGLPPLQGTWSLGLSFEGFLPYTMIPKGTPCPTRRDETCEGNRSQKPISCAASPRHSAILPPGTVKNRTVGFSSAGAIWTHGRKCSAECKTNSSVSHLRQKETGWSRKP